MKAAVLPLTGISGKYLYLFGGHHSADTGCPPWGSSDPADIRFIGDRMGELIIAYADGSEDSVPLVLGYTLWLHSIWNESPAPFFGEDRDESLTAALAETLCLWGTWEHREEGVLRIALPDRGVESVTVLPDAGKNGHPVFSRAVITDAESLLEAPDADFFRLHTVLPGEMPAVHRENLDRICHALHTFDEDFTDVPSPAESGVFLFRGSSEANIATGVVRANLDNLLERTDEDGFIHTSYKDAPSWRYDGFGPYVARANSYYDSFYSRDAARAIMTLAGYGYAPQAAAGCAFGGKWMMVYPEQGLTLGGQPIPGHYSVIPNKPFIYSQVLTKIGLPALCDDPDGASMGAWPTRYTRRAFGEECENLGNQETDGHGLMMLANYAAWRAEGKSIDYIRRNRTHIWEAAKWILWCFAHPKLSFAENDLLYGETEAAMNAYTLYANVPCCLGLTACAEMAEAIGEQQTAALWRDCALRMRRGIEAGLTDGEGWNSEKFGFVHDPVPTMLSDLYGYDAADMPAGWLARSRRTYPADLAKTVAHGWYGANGIGYNHAMITQNAMLLDQTADYTRLMESLSRLSYSPRLPEPYLVPEGLAVDAERGILRRQGDLGNLVQLAEALKCYLLAAGISPEQEGVQKIMPRLPAGWSISVNDFPLSGGASLSMEASSPVGSTQSIDLRIRGELKASLKVRFGPFAPEFTTAQVTLNGRTHTIPLEQSGDAMWGWLEG